MLEKKYLALSKKADVNVLSYQLDVGGSQTALADHTKAKVLQRDRRQITA